MNCTVLFAIIGIKIYSFFEVGVKVTTDIPIIRISSSFVHSLSDLMQSKHFVAKCKTIKRNFSKRQKEIVVNYPI